MVTQKEIIEALRHAECASVNWETSPSNALANRIESEGIAPPDGLELIADIEGIGCCTVVIRNGRVNIAAETVRDIINIGAGKIAPPDGWVLVPSEPTAEMLEAAGREVFKSAMVEWGDAASFAEKTIMDEQAKFYKAMLAAAPKGVSHER